MTKILIVVGVLIAAFAGFILLSNRKPQTPITSYEDCIAQGNPSLESYPPQCKTKNGQTFVQDIGNELEKTDIITIDNPRPNQRISSPLKITGKARGTWFFEANFPVRLIDDRGEEIAQSYATATGEWMTEDFVPFESEIEFNTTAKKGKLILEKSNPSDLPENADLLEIPVNF